MWLKYCLVFFPDILFSLGGDGEPKNLNCSDIKYDNIYRCDKRLSVLKQEKCMLASVSK